LLIGRQARRELYNLTPKPDALPIAREYCLETGGRLNAQGEVIEPLTDDDKKMLLTQLRQLKPQAVAINLLFSYLDDQFEKELEALLQQEFFVSRSSRVLAEYREYERGIVTWINAWLGPLVQQYLARLHQAVSPTPLSIMQSSGGTIDANAAGQYAVNLLLSGPAGGLKGAQYIAQCSQRKKIMTVDMGGTSTDVALIDGDIKLTTRGVIDNLPIAVPMVDMHTIGAGGGSIAYLDAGGLLQVGPESAGASPGPACYGKGGTQPTVTDANLILGRILPDAFLGGNMRLDYEAAVKAMQTIAQPLSISVQQAAAGIIRIADEHMTAALRVISVQRGVDPREYTLVPFGGAGGLHVCALADALGMQEILIPLHGGVLSALGMVVSPHTRQASRTVACLLNSINTINIKQELTAMDADLREALQQEVDADTCLQSQWSVDLRYAGQSFFLNLAWDEDINLMAESFHKAHTRMYGHALDEPVELVNLRVAVSSEPLSLSFTSSPTQSVLEQQGGKTAAMGAEAIPAWWRSELEVDQEIAGPGLILEPVATSYIGGGWSCRKDEIGNLVLTLL
jgi:N-methylhydantoinase A